MFSTITISLDLCKNTQRILTEYNWASYMIKSKDKEGI